MEIQVHLPVRAVARIRVEESEVREWLIEAHDPEDPEAPNPDLMAITPAIIMAWLEAHPGDELYVDDYAEENLVTFDADSDADPVVIWIDGAEVCTVFIRRPAEWVSERQQPVLAGEEGEG